MHKIQVTRRLPINEIHNLRDFVRQNITEWCSWAWLIVFHRYNLMKSLMGILEVWQAFTMQPAFCTEKKNELLIGKWQSEITIYRGHSCPALLPYRTRKTKEWEKLMSLLTRPLIHYCKLSNTFKSDKVSFLHMNNIDQRSGKAAAPAAPK